MKVRDLLKYLQMFNDDDEVQLTLWNESMMYTDKCEGISYDRGQVSLLNVKGDMV